MKLTYYCIHEWMINELHLSGNELLIYALIFSFLEKGQSFYGSKQYISDCTGATTRTVLNVFKSLEKKGLIEIQKKGINNYINSTEKTRNFFKNNGKKFPKNQENFSQNEEKNSNIYIKDIFEEIMDDDIYVKEGVYD